MTHQLPPEIWHKIVNLSSSPAQTLCSLSRTSRTFLELTRPRIFSSVTINTSNGFLALHRVKSLHDPTFSGICFERSVWGTTNPLLDVTRLEVSDFKDDERAGGEVGWRRFDMYSEPAGLAQSGYQHGGSVAEKKPESKASNIFHGYTPSFQSIANESAVRATVTSFTISKLAHTVVRFPNLTFLSLHFIIHPTSYDTLDASFRAWLCGSLVHGKLKAVSLRGVRDIGVDLSAALLSAEEADVADCSFAPIPQEMGIQQKLDLKMHKAFVASSMRLTTLRFETPHSKDIQKGLQSTLADHWGLLGLNTEFKSTVRNLDISANTYDAFPLLSASSLIRVLSYYTPSSMSTAYPALRSLSISTTPLHLSHLSLQPPPDPSLVSSRVVFYPSTTAMSLKHGNNASQNPKCWMDRMEFDLHNLESGHWRDAMLIVKQRASMASSAPADRVGSSKNSRKSGSDFDDAELELGLHEVWFKRLMRDTGFLHSSTPSAPASPCIPTMSSPPALCSLSFNASFWLTPSSSPEASPYTNGELASVLSYLSSLCRTPQAADALETIEVVVKVGTGDCIENLKIWTGSHLGPLASYSTTPFASSTGTCPLLAYKGFQTLGRILASPAFTHLSRVKVVLECRLACQWAVEGVKDVVWGVVRVVEEELKDGLGMVAGVDVDVGFRLV